MLILGLFQNPLYLLAFVVALIIAITVHEYAHAWMAYRAGDPTAKIEGRLSLNPMVHLDPLGTLFLFIAGFGWGKPVPINPDFFKKKTDELKVALAGIFMNILVAFVLAIPLRIALINGQTIDSSQFLTFLNIIVELNIFLAAFNLIPIAPLDGSHVVEYFLIEPAKQTSRFIGPYLLIGLLIMDRLGNTSIIFTMMEPVIRFLSFLIKGTPMAIM